MKVTIIGAGNSGLAMAAHLGKEGNKVTLWNRSSSNISKLAETRLIRCDGVVKGDIRIDLVTDDIELALRDPDIVLITTPANSHKELAETIAKNIRKSTTIVLNPGRTFGALEFRNIYKKYNQLFEQVIAETQTIIYTCRKINDDSVNIIAFKDSVLIAALDTDTDAGAGADAGAYTDLDAVDSKPNINIIELLPDCVKEYFIPADSMIQTSIGNVGMILHCAPLLLNTGWTESKTNIYKYYYDGITPTVGSLIEKIDFERVAVSKALGHKVETTREWLIRTYHVKGNSLYECIQNNEVYKTIDAPDSLNHRYIFEDIPCGLVPLEAVGIKLGLDMTCTSLVIDLASRLLETDFRRYGRHLDFLDIDIDLKGIRAKTVFESGIENAS